MKVISHDIAPMQAATLRHNRRSNERFIAASPTYRVVTAFDISQDNSENGRDRAA